MKEYNSMNQLSIVIHTEEEFNWNGGFFRSNNKVTHGRELIEFCEEIINVGGKVTLAMDYAFVNSEQGQQVICHFKNNKAIEFATHLHPWVNPPFIDDENKIRETNSYPGNLPEEEEFQKLKVLTDMIEDKVGYKPTTYLAGRYGIGANTNKTLKELGYKTDISISPFTDYSNQLGPNFNHRNNSVFIENGISNWPHTTGVVSKVSLLTKYFNANPSYYAQSFQKLSTKIVNKLARVRRQRLSPEGFNLSDMKKLTLSQIALGQTDFIFSFHSPSVKLGLTPYVEVEKDLTQFKQNTLDYIQWFTETVHGEHILVKDH